MPSFRDITGQKFNHLTAIKFVSKKNSSSYWLFRCDCGNEKVILGRSVTSSNTLACGCKRKSICSVVDCYKLSSARGWCKFHYERWRCFGHPLNFGTRKIKLSIEERLLKNREIDKITHCWNWLGCLDKYGYGRINIKGKVKKAHRVAYQYFNSTDIPEDLVVNHLCCNKKCFNPEHLEAVSHTENIVYSLKSRASTLPSSLEFYSSYGNLSCNDVCSKGHRLDHDNIYVVRTKSGFGRKCKTCGNDNRINRVENQFVKHIRNFVGANNKIRGLEGSKLKKDLYKKLESLDFKCVYCGSKYECFDHVIPKAKNGKTIVTNLVPSCNKCNWSKNSKTTKTASETITAPKI